MHAAMRSKPPTQGDAQWLSAVRYAELLRSSSGLHGRRDMKRIDQLFHGGLPKKLITIGYRHAHCSFACLKAPELPVSARSLSLDPTCGPSWLWPNRTSAGEGGSCRLGCVLHGGTTRIDRSMWMSRQTEGGLQSSKLLGTINVQVGVEHRVLDG